MFSKEIARNYKTIKIFRCIKNMTFSYKANIYPATIQRQGIVDMLMQLAIPNYLKY